VFHRHIEPECNAGGYELDRKEKKQDGGNQRKAGKGDHQFGSQLCPHDLSFAVIEKLHDVSEDQQDQQQQHKHVDVDEDEHDDCVGNGQPCPKTDDPGFCIGNETYHHDKDQHYDPFTLAASGFFF
jgi:hypothetical protein